MKKSEKRRPKLKDSRRKSARMRRPNELKRPKELKKTRMSRNN